MPQNKTKGGIAVNELLHAHANTILQSAIRAVLPGPAVRRALAQHRFTGSGRVYAVAVGKAAWQMADAAAGWLRDAGVPLAGGVAVTKYGHVQGSIPGFACYEGGHPVPDANGFAGTAKALALVQDLRAEDTVLFLLSGGASALFEQPLVPAAELQSITRQLLACGADITEINTVRKRLSAVKGGRFAQACAPARVFSILLSDVLGDAPDQIGSGPTVADPNTCAQALAVAEKYRLILSDKARACLFSETPKELPTSEIIVTGSVRELCRAAAEACRALGYEPQLLTDCLQGEAHEAGRWLAGLAAAQVGTGRRLALIAGGETVVHVTGPGLGGRSQELALAAAPDLAGLDAAVFAFGSDGTDGPTDAAGGYVDGGTAAALAAHGLTAAEVLRKNDAYHALQSIGGLLVTGPTGTNVNDAYIALVGG